MALLDMRSTLDLATGERPMAWRLKFHETFPNATSLMTVILRACQRRKVMDQDSQVNWWERAHAQRELVVSSGDVPGAVAAGSADTVSVSSNAYECPKHTLLINATTLEVVRVTADPSSDTALAFKRGIGETGTMDAWTAGDILQVIGTAHPEGDSVPKAISRPPTKRDNYLEIFRNSTDNTRTALNTRLRTEDLRKRAKRDALKDHEVSKAMSLLFGRASEESGSEGVIRTTGGLIERCTTHIYDASAGFYKSAFRTWFYDVMELGSSEKWLAVGISLAKVIEEMCEEYSLHFREVPGTDTYGIAVKTLTWGGKKMHISTEGALSQSSAFKTWGFCLDMEAIEYAYLQNADTDWKPNRQNPGDDRNIGEWLAECGWVLYNADDVMGYITGASTFAG